MVDEKKGSTGNRVSPEQRMHYIGFEVFPGKPKDLFKNPAEQQEFVEGIRARREKGTILRDQCTLTVERISFGERLVLAVASVAILAALVLPWYSAYTEIVEEAPLTEEVAVLTDSLGNPLDSAVGALTGETAGLDGSMAADETIAGEVAPDETEELAITTEAGEGEGGEVAASPISSGSNEEIITGHQFRKEVRREYSSLTGFGTFLALGSVGGYVFSSGLVLMLTGVLMLLYSICCLALPFMNMYYIFGLKGTPDAKAVQMKNSLRANWLPLIIFLVVFALSFVGAEYGFDTTGMFTSLGSSYGPGVLLDTMSWGIFVSLAASILVAVKGVEI